VVEEPQNSPKLVPMDCDVLIGRAGLLENADVLFVHCKCEVKLDFEGDDPVVSFSREEPNCVKTEHWVSGR
jgi:hypothetical protein